MFICLYLDFAREFVDIIVHILRTHIQSILFAFLAYQRQSYLMINEKSKKRATLSLASASIINVKAILSPEIIIVIAFHPLKIYERKFLERVQQ